METTLSGSDEAPVPPLLAMPKFLGNVDLTILTPAQSGFVISVWLLQDDIELNSWNGTDVKCAFADRFRPAQLFDGSIQSLSSFYSKVRDFLDRHGSNMTKHGSRRVIMTLASNISEEADDRDTALQM